MRTLTKATMRLLGLPLARLSVRMASWLVVCTSVACTASMREKARRHSTRKLRWLSKSRPKSALSTNLLMSAAVARRSLSALMLSSASWAVHACNNRHPSSEVGFAQPLADETETGRTETRRAQT